MHNRLLRIAFIVITGILTISCQPVVPQSPNALENAIQDVRVVLATEPTRTTMKVEQFPLPNCGGSDKLTQGLRMYASASQSATVGAKASIKGGGEAAIPETVKLKLEIQVEASYQKTFESANSRLDSIEMSAAAGTHVIYTVVWEEQAFTSIVRYSASGQVYEAPYTYKLVVPKIDKSYSVVCPGGNGDSTPKTVAPAVTPPISTEPATAAGKGKYPCPLIVKRSQVDTWKVGQTTVAAVDEALNEFAALRPNDAGAFVMGTPIPSGVLIATDFGEATGWTRYPVTPVIHSGGWGLFESTGEYTAPKPGACMTIAP